MADGKKNYTESIQNEIGKEEADRKDPEREKKKFGKLSKGIQGCADSVRERITKKKKRQVTLSIGLIRKERD